MSWGKIDDQFHAHRKAKRAWKACPASLGLHLLAISYCAGHLTDGLVDHEFVEEKIPAARRREQATRALVDAGLWVIEEGGWRINDWLDYNPSRADVLEKRRSDAARKARRLRAESTGTPRGVRADSRAGARAPVPAVPDPTTPTAPLPPRGGRDRDRIRYEGELAEFSATHFPGINVGYVSHFAASMRAVGREPTVNALRPLVEEFATNGRGPA